MSKKVFANNMEVLSKSSSGKVTAAFPDVCFSPPAPPVGPIPLPYPNSAKDTDLDKGTTSVFIADKMVGMQDSSYLQTSQGDEGATQSQTKGIISQSIQGKAYAIIWSTNVQAEGMGVPRHLDMLTVNHASMMGNGAPMAHVSDASAGGVTVENTPDETVGRLVAIDLLRSKSNNVYHTRNNFIQDTEILCEGDSIQYVNLHSLTAQEIQDYGLLKENERCALGRRIEIRIRFSKKEEFFFKFTIKKSSPAEEKQSTSTVERKTSWLYDDGEASQNRFGDNAFYKFASGGTQKKSKNDILEATLKTDSSGICKITIDLDASGCTYTITASETHVDSQKSVNLVVEAWRRLFFNVYMEEKIVEDGIQSVRDEIEGNYSKIKDKIDKDVIMLNFKIEMQKELKLSCEKQFAILVQESKKIQSDIQSVLSGKKLSRKKKRAVLEDLQNKNNNKLFQKTTIQKTIYDCEKSVNDATSKISELEKQKYDALTEKQNQMRELDDSINNKTFFPRNIKKALDSVIAMYKNFKIELSLLAHYDFARSEFLDGNPYPDNDVAMEKDNIELSQCIQDFKDIITSRTKNIQRRYLFDVILLASMNPYIIRQAPIGFGSENNFGLLGLELVDGRYVSRASFKTDHEIKNRALACGENYKLTRDSLVEGNVSIKISNIQNFEVATFSRKLKNEHIIFRDDGLNFIFSIPECDIFESDTPRVPSGGYIDITSASYRFRLRSSVGGFALISRAEPDIVRRFRGIVIRAYNYTNDIPEPMLFSTLSNIIMHELAHNLSMVPGAKCKLTKSPYFFDEKGFSGNHCSSGMNDAEKALESYRGQTGANCMMFGATVSSVFCDECTNALLKTDCNVKFELF